MQWKIDLIKDIRTHTPADDLDRDVEIPPHIEMGHGIAMMRDIFLQRKDQIHSILEIGINYYGFTEIFCNQKNPDTVYIGIDIEPRELPANPNIHQITNSSSDYTKNVKKINALGVRSFDLIFIDGWHSINQVLLDWQYTKLLSENGMIAVHDTAYHPGPRELVKYLNPNLWHVYPNIAEEFPDYGLALIWKNDGDA